MWVLRAAKWCASASCRAGMELLGPTCPSSYLALSLLSQTLLANRGYRLLQLRFHIYDKITKNKLLMNKKRDASFENLMDSEKRMKIMRRIVALLSKQPSGKLLYRYMLRKGKDVGVVKDQRISELLKKCPRIIRIYREPNEIEAWVTLEKPALALLEEEKRIKQERTQFCIERLRKLLMMSATRRIRLDRIEFLKEELGLPDDFKQTVIRSNPKFFKVVKARVDMGKDVFPTVKLVEWDPQLAIPAVEEYRQKSALASGKMRAYSFPISFPPGFEIKKGFRYKLREWQELPYPSPYQDTRDLSLQSPEAFKRAVAVLHEFLRISVEKRTRVDRFAHLREDMKLPQKLGITVLQNPGIFYMSTKSDVQTIFLREAYKKGELIQKDTLHVVKEKFLDLVKMGRKNVKKLEAEQAETNVGTSLVDKGDQVTIQGDTNSEEDEAVDERFSGRAGNKSQLNGNIYSEEDDTCRLGREDVVIDLQAWSEDDINFDDQNLDSEKVVRES